MKKITGALYFLVMACAVFGGSGGGELSGSNVVDTAEVKQVAVLTSPALEMYSDYKIFVSADISGMGDAQYYVAGDLGAESSQAALNLGFSEEFDTNSSLAFVNASTGRVVFAYNPKGTADTWKTGGNISVSGGKLLEYNSLEINENQSSVAALEYDESDITYITLSTTYATLTKSGTSTAVPRYTYVWHADPDYRYEYFTKGIYGSIVGSPANGIGYEYESDFTANTNDVYIARDIRYMTENTTKDGENEYAAYYSSSVADELADEKGSDYAGPYIFATLPITQGSSLSAVKELMTHSASEAYNNPVLHITKSGIYSLSGVWTGQISIEADAVIILNGVTVTCTVAPAIVFTDSATEYGEDNSASVAAASMDIGENLLDTLTENQANIVIIADGSVNNVTGANVYRLLKAEPKSSATKVDGTDISDQKKRYKADGAFYSFVSLAVCGDENGTGILNITSSTLEGLGSELHLTVDGGIISVTAPDDTVNVNEDDISVFTMLSGTLTLKSANGDGIDSNGYVVINNGNLNITAGNQRINSNGEAGIDAEKGCYIASGATYTWTSVSGNGGGNEPSPAPNPIEPSNPTPAPNNNDIQPTPTRPDINENEDEDYWLYIQQQNQEQTQTQTQNEENYKYSDADVLKAAKQTDKGMTAINIGTGSSVSFIQKDTDTKPRNISQSGYIFRLNRKVNTFSGITKYENKK